MPQDPVDVNDLMTSEEVIQRLSSEPDLRRLALTCVLPGVRYADEWRFRRSDLEAWITRQRAMLAS